MPRTATGKYRIRVMILARVLAAQSANGEEVESWPDPTPGTNEYFAAQDALSGGEQIVQGLRASTGFMKLRIKGRHIPVQAVDRLKVKATGELFNVTGVARESADTVLSVERVPQQAVKQ